jgi:hypothetical protein
MFNRSVHAALQQTADLSLLTVIGCKAYQAAVVRVPLTKECEVDCFYVHFKFTDFLQRSARGENCTQMLGALGVENIAKHTGSAA